MKSPLFAVATVFALLMSCFGSAAMALEVPKDKQTTLGKYLTANEAHDLVTAERDKVLFVDVRTAAELMFVGMTNDIDAHVPFVDLPSPPAWDDKNGRLQLVPNPSFVSEVEALLARKGLGKADKVIVICRSGDRTVKAVNALAGAGFTNAWSVYEGFEGDLSPDGRRTVNGWKNAGLPWTYKLDKGKLFLAPVAAR